MDVISQLKRDEGFSARPYRDPSGNLTIGYGRNLDAWPLAEDEADYLLRRAVDQVRAELLARLPWVAQLDEPRQAVLLNMAYNMGVAGLLTFGLMLQAAAAGDYARAAAEMLRSRWAKQVGKRAERLARQMQTGQWV